MFSQLIYDGSYTGWLSAVFAAYEYRIASPQMVASRFADQSLFGDQVVSIDEAKARRVMDKMKTVFSKDGVRKVYWAFLSEKKGIENELFAFLKYGLESNINIEKDFSHPAVLCVHQVSRQVHREKHRMEAFVRFQLTADGLYYAFIEPDYNVLPLIADHFRRRYADQRWLIYDGKRRYGIQYDLKKVSTVEITFDDAVRPDDIAAIYDEQEIFFQEMWRKYFQTVNIKARKNTRLHIQHMPRRYWRNLIEKQPDQIL